MFWFNNYDYKETFQSRTAQDYIEKNMEIVYLDRPLFENPGEWIEGHSDYVEFDPKSTWYYKNVVAKEQAIASTSEEEQQPSPPAPSNEIVWIDETEKVVEYYEDAEPLADRQRKLLKKSIKKGKEPAVEDEEEEDGDAGRPVKRSRTTH